MEVVEIEIVESAGDAGSSSTKARFLWYALSRRSSFTLKVGLPVSGDFGAFFGVGGLCSNFSHFRIVSFFSVLYAKAGTVPFALGTTVQESESESANSAWVAAIKF